MASGPETEKLIVTFQEKAKKAAKDKTEVDKCQQGFEIKDADPMKIKSVKVTTPKK